MFPFAFYLLNLPYRFAFWRSVRQSHKHIDFASLSDWSKERNGQVIVCENGDADWLPFIRLGKLNGTFNCKAEVFWTNEKLEYQTTLF